MEQEEKKIRTGGEMKEQRKGFRRDEMKGRKE
jgi:hypothetical protein